MLLIQRDLQGKFRVKNTKKEGVESQKIVLLVTETDDAEAWVFGDKDYKEIRGTVHHKEKVCSFVKINNNELAFYGDTIPKVLMNRIAFKVNLIYRALVFLGDNFKGDAVELRPRSYKYIPGEIHNITMRYGETKRFRDLMY